MFECAEESRGYLEVRAGRWRFGKVEQQGGISQPAPSRPTERASFFEGKRLSDGNAADFLLPQFLFDLWASSHSQSVFFSCSYFCHPAAFQRLWHYLLLSLCVCSVSLKPGTNSLLLWFTKRMHNYLLFQTSDLTFSLFPRYLHVYLQGCEEMDLL